MSIQIKALICWVAFVMVLAISSVSVEAKTSTAFATTSGDSGTNQEVIQWANSKGFLESDAQGEYRLDTYVTEAEYVVMLQKFFNVPSIKQQLTKRDSQAKHFADDAYNAMVPYKIPLNGYLHEFIREQPIKKGIVAQSLMYFDGYEVRLEEAVIQLVDDQVFKDSNGQYENFNATGPITKAQIIDVFYNIRHWDNNLQDMNYNDSTTNINSFARTGLNRVDDTLKFDVNALLKDVLNKAPNITVPSSSSTFDQGKGYEQGLYDNNAILPTPSNWNRISRFVGPAKRPKKVWSYTTPSFVDSAITIAKNGTMYFTNGMGDLIAVSKKGEQQWRFSLPANSKSRSEVVIGKDGTIYYTARNDNAKKNKNLKYFCENSQCNESVLLAIKSNGKLKWSVGLKYANDNGSPAIDKNGNIHVATGPFKHDRNYKFVPTYYKVSPAGKIVSTNKLETWEVPMTTPILSRNNRMFIQNNIFDGDKYSMNSWQAGAPATSFSTPVLDNNGNFYYGTYLGSLGFIANDGSSAFELILESSEEDVGTRISSTPVIGKNNRVHIGTETGTIYSIPKNELISYKEDKFSTVANKVFVFDNKKPLNAWTYQTDGWVTALISDRNGTLYASTEKGTVYAISPAGKLIWKISIGNELHIYDLAIGDGNNLFALASDSTSKGYLIALK